MKNRHTVSYLANRLSLAGAKPQRKFGQNFLIDLNLIELIARTADLSQHDVVLEVGTGTGSLTSHIAELAGQVVTVELDPFMQQIASEELAEYEHVTLLKCDALASKHEVNPEVLKLIETKRSQLVASQWKLVANLPYNIATPLMANLFALPDPPTQMVVTIQFEMAERIVAKPSTDAYGALSVWLQAQADCFTIRKLPPQVFWPKPNVDSAIVKIVRNDIKRAQLGDIALFHELVKAMFAHRRKKVAGQLAEFAKLAGVSFHAEELLAKQGLSLNVRAEQLSVETIVLLNQAIQSTAGLI